MKIDNKEKLRVLYDFPKGRSEVKVLPTLEKHSIHFINTSPFLTLATIDAEGKMDCSPRGGTPGFVKVINNNTIIIPDSKGNNRLDSIVNVIETNKVGCLFIIPGVDETLRINGSASISTDENYLRMYPNEKNPPKCIIEIKVNEVYLHCAKAFMRSKLWAEESKIDRKSFPTMGEMINDQTGDQSEIETQETMIERYKENL